MLDISSGKATDLIEDDDAGPPLWTTNDEVVRICGKPTGNTDIVIINVKNASESYTAGVIPATIWGARVLVLSEQELVLAFAGKANADGSLFNPEDQPKASTVKYYTTGQPRYWDSWTIPQKNAIFYITLEREESGKFAILKVRNALQATEPKLESPIPPFGDEGHFDISKNGIVFTARDPANHPTLSTSTDAYYVPVQDYKQPPGKASKFSTPWLKSVVSSPTFSPSGKQLVFLKMERENYEGDRNNILLVKDIAAGFQPTEILKADGKDLWNLNPNTIQFLDEDNFLICADDNARRAAFTLPTNPAKGEVPKKVIHTGSVISAEQLGNNKLLVSSESLVTSSVISVLDLSKVSEADKHFRVLISSADYFAPFGLSEDQVTDITWKGAKGRDVHGLVMKPSNFSKEKKYPVCFLLHGGPQFAFNDKYQHFGLSTTLYAEQGYIVVMPNFVGSTGYGQDFTDGLHGQWGGHSCEDVDKCFEHVKKTMPYADTSRAIAGGMSWGGYFVNWIQGQDLGRKFKALFTINGSFSVYSWLGSDELFFPMWEFDGLPWDSEETRAKWDKWDPMRYVHNWATPHIIVHTSLDYRCPPENGLAAFNALQARGVDSALLWFEDEGHAILNPENQLVLNNTVLNFCNKRVGLPAVAEEIVPIR